MKSKRNEALFYKEKCLGLKIAHNLTGYIGPYSSIKLKSQPHLGTVATFYIRAKINVPSVVIE